MTFGLHRAARDTDFGLDNFADPRDAAREYGLRPSFFRFGDWLGDIVLYASRLTGRERVRLTALKAAQHGIIVPVEGSRRRYHLAEEFAEKLRRTPDYFEEEFYRRLRPHRF